MTMSACGSVRLSVNICLKTTFAKFFVHDAYGRGAFFLGLRCNMLCTLRVVNRVILSCNGPYGAGDASIDVPQNHSYRVSTDPRSESDVDDCLAKSEK